MSFILNSGRFGGAVDPGLTLLQSATLWLDASDPGADSQKVQNKGTGGSALDARYGSTTGVDTNDPLLLTHTGTNYLYLPGATGNHASAPDIAAYTPTSEMEIIMRVQLADYTPASASALMSHDASFDNGWSFGLSTAGNLQWNLNNGAPLYSSTAAASLTDGTAYWIRATWKASDFARFYYAADQTTVPSSWTQVGSDVATTATAPANSTTTLKVLGGSGPSVQPGLLAGSAYRAIYRTTIGGSAVFDADFTTNTGQSTFTESSSNAATVTINRSTSGRKAVMVTRPVWLFGTDDYMEIADNALLDFEASGDMTVLAVARRFNTPPASARILSKREVAGSNPGWDLLGDAPGSQIFTALVDVGASSSTFPAGASQTTTAGQMHLIGAIFDRTNALVKATIGNSISAGGSMPAGDTSNTAPLAVGRLQGGTGYADMEIIAVAVFKGTALTSAELGQIATYLGV